MNNKHISLDVHSSAVINNILGQIGNPEERDECLQIYFDFLFDFNYQLRNSRTLLYKDDYI